MGPLLVDTVARLKENIRVFIIQTQHKSTKESKAPTSISNHFGPSALEFGNNSKDIGGAYI